MSEKLIDTWLKIQAEEDSMSEDHIPLWKVMIQRMSENNLNDQVVLDFGCNQGGFLRLLYSEKPFRRGFGIDLARKSIEVANERVGDLPISYEARGNIEHLNQEIDIAFSHEVIYLLADVDAHAKQIYKALKSNGVYYAALGCNTDTPLWVKWKAMLEEETNLKVNSYSLNFIADTFRNNGFTVFAQKYMLDDFRIMNANDEYFPNIIDSLNYYWDYKILLKFTKDASS